MNIQQAVDKIVAEFPEGEKYRDFFEREVRSIVGEGFVSTELYEQIRKHFNEFS